MAASRLCPKVDVVLWSSSRVSRRCSWAARSKAVLKHTGMDGTMAPRVWISNTVTTSYGFLNTCEVSADNRKNTRGSFSSLFEHTK